MVGSLRIRWAEHVALMGDKRTAFRIFVGKPEERDHHEDLDIGGMIILKWISVIKNWVVWTALMWLRIATSEGLL